MVNAKNKEDWMQSAWSRIRQAAMPSASVNAKDDQGDTPLHYAAHENDHETIAVLLDEGALVNAKNNNPHQTAEVLRCHGGHE